MQTQAEILIPDKLVPVFQGEADVRASFGGRGSGKTRTFAKMTAVRAYMWDMALREGIILCGRQFMNSLDESSLAMACRGFRDWREIRQDEKRAHLVQVHGP
jgi:phage terminase large subunit